LEEKEGEQKTRFKAPSLKTIKSDKNVGHEKGETKVKDVKKEIKEVKELKSQKTSEPKVKAKSIQRRSMTNG